MREIGIGVIGWGFMGKTHTHAIRALPLFYSDSDIRPVLIGVCSRTVEKAEKAKEDLGFQFATGDWRELLKDPRIEVVSICTPNGQHAEMAVEAVRAGKHVYLEKPMAVTWEEARRVQEEAEKAGVCAQVVFNNRFLPSIMRAKELVEEGKIGELLSFSCRYLHSGSIDENRPMAWKMSTEGGVLLDLGSHALDLLTWLMGRPESVFMASRTLYSARPTKDGGMCADLSEDQALAMLRMPSGALGTIEASKIATGASDELLMEIYGKKGALRWSLMEPSFLYFYDNTRPEKPLGGERGWTQIECVGRYAPPGGAFLPSKNTIGWDRGHIHSYYSFLDCVAHGKPCSPSLAEGAYLQYVMEKLKESAACGQWVDL